MIGRDAEMFIAGRIPRTAVALRTPSKSIKQAHNDYDIIARGSLRSGRKTTLIRIVGLESHQGGEIRRVINWKLNKDEGGGGAEDHQN
jgi:hypothetical protein